MKLEGLALVVLAATVTIIVMTGCSSQPEPVAAPAPSYSVDNTPGSRVSLDEAFAFAVDQGGWTASPDEFHQAAVAHCEGMALMGPAQWYMTLDEPDPLTEQQRATFDAAAVYGCPDLADEVLPNGVPGL